MKSRGAYMPGRVIAFRDSEIAREVVTEGRNGETVVGVVCRHRLADGSRQWAAIRTDGIEVGRARTMFGAVDVLADRLDEDALFEKAARS